MYEMVSRLNWSSFGHFRPSTIRVLSFGNQNGGVHCKSWGFQSVNGLIVIGSFLSFLLAMGYGYLYLFPSFHPVIHNYGIPKFTDSDGECNLFDGRWIPDESYPLYNASECPFAEQGFNCLANRRKDRGYLKWRWKPKNCDIPRFDVHAILEKLRGKRIVFVGDSLSRTQWESMICLLMTGVEDKKSVYEVNGNKITKQIRYLGVRFSSFNFTTEFYRSIFLVLPASVPKRAPKRVKSTLKLDKLDDISKEWIDSDILVFNSGHWWTPGKLFEIGGTRQNCKVTRRPLSKTKGRERSPFSDTVIKVVKNMTAPVTVLHVTPMAAFRSDAHVGTWSDNPSVPDCSHWCLPGVPDVWNEILFSYMLSQKRVSLQ